MCSLLARPRIFHPWEAEAVPSDHAIRRPTMTKFKITHGDMTTTEVEAGQYDLNHGFFDFTTYEDGFSVQIMSVRESAVIKIERVK